MSFVGQDKKLMMELTQSCEWHFPLGGERLGGTSCPSSWCSGVIWRWGTNSPLLYINPVFPSPSKLLKCCSDPAPDPCTGAEPPHLHCKCGILEWFGLEGTLKPHPGDIFYCPRVFLALGTSRDTPDLVPPGHSLALGTRLSLTLYTSCGLNKVG